MKTQVLVALMALTPAVVQADIFSSINDAISDVRENGFEVPELTNTAPATTTGGTSNQVAAQGACEGVEFGDNSSIFSNDGECDDPRFQGPGVALGNLASDAFHDANDCQAMCDQGQATFIGGFEEYAPVPVDPGMCADIEYGDNSSVYSNDGECDDPRFEGPGVASVNLPSDAFHDANDCQALCNAGQASFIGGFEEYAPVGSGGKTGASSPPETPTGSIDFGDNLGGYPNDGECDDPRFIGVGMALSLTSENAMHDATDCRTLFDVGLVSMGATEADFDPSLCAYLNFGDNSSEWINNGVCDDPRFNGPGTDPIKNLDDIGSDANDCQSLCRAGQIYPR